MPTTTGRKPRHDGFPNESEATKENPRQRGGASGLTGTAEPFRGWMMGITGVWALSVVPIRLLEVRY